MQKSFRKEEDAILIFKILKMSMRQWWSAIFCLYLLLQSPSLRFYVLSRRQNEHYGLSASDSSWHDRHLRFVELHICQSIYIFILATHIKATDKKMRYVRRSEGIPCFNRNTQRSEVHYGKVFYHYHIKEGGSYI